MQINLVALLRERLPEMPLVVMTKEPDPASYLLELQDYIIGGESVLPLFSSQQALAVSLPGADLGRPIYAIRRDLLVLLLHRSEVRLLPCHGAHGSLGVQRVFGQWCSGCPKVYAGVISAERH